MKITTAVIRQMKEKKLPIAMITAYDYPWAKMFDEAGAEMLLVGDSLGNVVLGYESTLPVTMEDMIHHAKAVCRGASKAMVVVDMPFMSYQVSVKQAVKNAGKIMKKTGAHAVKLEGGVEVAPAIKAIVDAGIPVVGHIGLTPQSVHQLGGYKVQGKDEATAKKLLDDAQALEEAGAFAVVLECVPTPLSKMITEKISIATIGIGAGIHCDGQVLVYHDMLSLFAGNSSPKFAKKYANLHDTIVDAVGTYVKEVHDKTFPTDEYSFKMDEETLNKLY